MERDNSRRVIQLVLNNFKNDSRVLKESKSLTRAGYTVTVLALHDHGQLEDEVVEGVVVHRLRLMSRAWSKNKIVQILKYAEFFIRAAKRCKTTDIVHCNDLSALPIGVFVKCFNRRIIRVVYDAHEYETEINGLRGIEKSLKRWLERWMIKYADKVITVSESIALEYQRLYGIEKPALVLNAPEFSNVERQNIFRSELDIRQDQTIFLYQGGLSTGRGIDLLLRAFSSAVGDKNVIVFMGYGPLETEIRRYAESCSTVFFREAVSPSILLSYTSSADYGVSLIEDTCLSYRYCLPNKIFEYLMAGLPLLCSNLPEMRFFVEKHGLGVVATEYSVKGFRDALNESLQLDREKVKNCVDHARAIFNWEEQEKVLLGVYHAL